MSKERLASAAIRKRKVLRLSGLVLWIFFVGLIYNRLDSLRDSRVAGEARRLATDAASRARDAFSAEEEALLRLASNASSNPILLTALRGGVDRATIADIFSSEDSWEPYRQL